MSTICFYSLQHIGDIYFCSTMINEICKSNPDLQFYYYSIHGTIFFEGISNIKRIDNLESEYIIPIANGEPPENLIDRKLFDILLPHACTSSINLNYNGSEILFINVWCASPYLNHTDFCFNSAIYSYNKMINIINNQYNINLNFPLPNPYSILHFMNKNSYKNINVIPDDLKETIFIFNYIPRSLSFDMNKLNKYINEISSLSKVILTCHDSIYDNNENVTFIDKTYGIYPVPSAENLLQIWDIASECKKVIILPTGSSWTFLHKLNKLGTDIVFMFNAESYTARLNDNIKFLTGVDKEVISNIFY